jgi:predicted ArsR family transcriptional regulator
MHLGRAGTGGARSQLDRPGSVVRVVHGYLDHRNDVVLLRWIAKRVETHDFLGGNFALAALANLGKGMLFGEAGRKRMHVHPDQILVVVLCQFDCDFRQLVAIVSSEFFHSWLPAINRLYTRNASGPSWSINFSPIPLFFRLFRCAPVVCANKPHSMNQKLIVEIGKSQRLHILNKLKRTHGLSVGELADVLDMSYMGVKQHCIDLHKSGYLDTWRRPKPKGRPEMLYRLTHRAHELFPTTSNELTIELLNSATKLFGPAAGEKLLFTVFQRKTEHYLARIKGETLEQKAKWLARLRDNEGCMSDLETNSGAMRIVEHHSPVLDLLRAFPIVARLEAEMFQRVLRVPVEREETGVSGLFCCVFYVGGKPASS